MPRLIPPELGNGKRPSDPTHNSGTVPVLDVSDDTHNLVSGAHDDGALLTGHVVLIDNPSPVGAADAAGSTIVGVGGSTLWEAATEIIAAVGEQASHMPKWVASTCGPLRDVLAEHFTVKGYSVCKPIELEEVPS